MKYAQIKETCLYVSDIELAVQFYHEILDFPLIHVSPNRHAFFRCGSSVLLCFLPEATKNEEELPPHFAFGKQHVAFEVSKRDYLKTKMDFMKKGIQLTHEQHWHSGLESFYFEDPFGNVLEVVPPGIWEYSPK
ncbi:MAG: VOC family protein [Nitritalea sp.]